MSCRPFLRGRIVPGLQQCLERPALAQRKDGGEAWHAAAAIQNVDQCCVDVGKRYALAAGNPFDMKSPSAPSVADRAAFQFLDFRRIAGRRATITSVPGARYFRSTAPAMVRRRPHRSLDRHDRFDGGLGCGFAVFRRGHLRPAASARSVLMPAGDSGTFAGRLDILGIGFAQRRRRDRRRPREFVADHAFRR